MNQAINLLERAQQAVVSGRQERARDLVSQVIAQDESNVEAWVLRARLATNPWEARHAWERVLALDPSNAEAGAYVASTEPAGGGTSEKEETPASVARPARRAAPFLTSLFAVGRRVAFYLLLLLVLMLLGFLGLEMARGAEFQDALRYGLTETVSYAAQIARGDLGMISAEGITIVPRPISEVLRDTLSKSLGLLGVSLMVASVVGVALGVLAARRRHSASALVFILASIIGVSVPSFFAAIFLQWLVIHYTRLSGNPAPLPVGGFGWDSHIILPAIVLAARPLAQITRVTFVSLGTALTQDYIRTAHSKGLRPFTIMRRHVFRNVLIPILTTIGLSLRFSLSSLPVVELFFAWPGVGATLLDAIARRDDKLTVALTLALGILFIAVNTLLDLSYRLIDPRLRDLAASARGEGGSLFTGIRAFLADLGAMAINNPLTRWFRERGKERAPNPFSQVLAKQGTPIEEMPHLYRNERRRALIRGTLRNVTFMLGATLFILLVAVFFLGPVIAPQSPYTRQLVAMVDGVIQAPPFKPGVDYPWGSDFLGRDIMSLVLVGAQQTMLLAILVVVGRMALGITLGALAGWQQGSRLDRAILSTAEIVSAFPTLLLAMILILALGIREGIRPFAIGLTLVGWGEVMQYVRSEVLGLKPKPFIESAVTIGLRAPRIVIGHVLPNLLPALISIAALEMGAVLMILGELGFVGIFIGGGVTTEGGGVGPGLHYSDVPEWGALLSNLHEYTRSYPWMAIYPAAAFFLAILTFNLLGEGIRRLIDDVGINMTRLANRYTLAVAVLLFLGWGWARDNTGEAAVYRRQAALFEGEQALAHVQALSAPEMEGRSIGTEGMQRAAEYIAEQFSALGLQHGGEDASYFQNKARSFQSLNAVPQLSIDDGGEGLAYHEDFVEFAGFFRNMGEGQGEVRLILFDQLQGSYGFSRTPGAMRRLDFSEDILLMLSGDKYLPTTSIPYAGALFVTDDPDRLERAVTLPPNAPNRNLIFSQDSAGDRPVLWISEEVADRLLGRAGLSLAEAQEMQEALEIEQVETMPLGVTASLSVTGTVHDRLPVQHVIGHLPGDSHEHDHNMIVVMAQYDSPPVNPAEPMAHANDNASGVAVMLEAIRTIQESGYQPYKTFLFIAYSGEGTEGGEWVNPPDVQDFLNAKYGFSGNFDIEAVINLRGVGAGTGEGPVFESGGSLRLARLFELASRRMGTGARRIVEEVDVGVIGAQGSGIVRSQGELSVQVHWGGWEESSQTGEDTVDTISAERLERIGEWLGHALMQMGRDVQY